MFSRHQPRPFRAVRLSRLLNMVHQVDVRVNRIAAPDDNEVGGFDLDRVRASLRADTGLPARHPWRHADGALHAGTSSRLKRSIPNR